MAIKKNYGPNETSHIEASVIILGNKSGAGGGIPWRKITNWFRAELAVK